jgi:hypothetical protein
MQYLIKSHDQYIMCAPLLAWITPKNVLQQEKNNFLIRLWMPDNGMTKIFTYTSLQLCFSPKEQINNLGRSPYVILLFCLDKTKEKTTTYTCWHKL